MRQQAGAYYGDKRGKEEELQSVGTSCNLLLSPRNKKMALPW